MEARKAEASTALVEVITKGIQEKKGENIVIMDLRGIEHAVCDYFVICNANTNTQTSAIADSVLKEARNTIGMKAWHTEGMDNSEWVLLDYVDVVVHIFQTQIREFYALEDLWGDAKITKIENNY